LLAEQRVFKAMGSMAHVYVLDAAPLLLDWAVNEVERLEQLWSRFRPTSDLTRLNAAAGLGPVAVHPLVIRAVEYAIELWEETDGLFDPTVHDALAALGYSTTFDKGDTGERGDPAGGGPTPGCRGIEIDVEAGTIALPAGVHLDLGGVGKGLAADIVAEGIVDRGGVGAAVGMGGDVRVAGTGPDRGGWEIDVEHPVTGAAKFLAWPLDVDHDAAIVTSTRLIRRWRAGGREVHHLVDPRTGTSADVETAAVIVAAHEAWWAEGLAKAALVADVTEGLRLLDRHDVVGWMVTVDGTVYPSAKTGRIA
jgi:thiamine biosynthesis lipoprotein